MIYTETVPPPYIRHKSYSALILRAFRLWRILKMAVFYATKFATCGTFLPHTLFRFFLVIGNVGKKKTAQACACAASLQLTDFIATCCGNQLIFYYDIYKSVPNFMEFLLNIFAAQIARTSGE